ncbi:MAG: FMN-binding protein [Candidatus Margulisbacteria bacterium]|nr:FMN-binding protein [Candidatus Margulisiibacteriota bacterium]
MDIKKLIDFAFRLSIVCVISGGLLAGVYLFTQNTISRNAHAAFEASIRAVLPEEGAAVTAEARGYSGPVEVILGIGRAGKIIGIKILSQRETPGLGNKIMDNGFLKQFIGLSKNSPIEVKVDIDAVTGASISSKAVCKAVRKALGK